MEQQQLKRDLKIAMYSLLPLVEQLGLVYFRLWKSYCLSRAFDHPSLLNCRDSAIFVMRALGELLLSNAGYTSFTDFASEYIGPWAGYITGWTYWFCWIMTAMADIIAVGVYTQYWFDIPQWVPAIGCLCIVITTKSINC